METKTNSRTHPSLKKAMEGRKVAARQGRNQIVKLKPKIEDPPSRRSYGAPSEDEDEDEKEKSSRK